MDDLPRLSRLSRQPQAPDAAQTRRSLRHESDPGLPGRWAVPLRQRPQIPATMGREMMARAISQRFGFKRVCALGLFVLAAIYLFATRPTPLQAEQASGRTVPVETVFRVVAAE